jgi:hypothetical protein
MIKRFIPTSIQAAFLITTTRRVPGACVPLQVQGTSFLVNVAKGCSPEGSISLFEVCPQLQRLKSLPIVLAIDSAENHDLACFSE